MVTLLIMALVVACTVTALMGWYVVIILRELQDAKDEAAAAKRQAHVLHTQVVAQEDQIKAHETTLEMLMAEVMK